MEHRFILSCESTVDLPYDYVAGRGIPVLFYSYLVDGISYPDDMGRDAQALPQFYERLASGIIPTTSQLNEFQYEEFFDGLLQEGDVLHIALGSGMTRSVYNAQAAAKTIQAKYPDRTITVLDSLCSSSGYGLLVDYAADLRDTGRSLAETAAWVTAHRGQVHHQFFSTQLDYYRRSGRMSGAVATLATVLNICPILRLDDGGRIIAYDKVRGKKRAIQRTLDVMQAHAEEGLAYQGKCFVCHSNCLEEARETKEAIEARFPQLAGTVRLCDIGTIIASHCGPGTVAVFFLGDERQPDKHK